MKILILTFLLTMASPLFGQTPAPQPQPLPGWTFSTSAGFSNVSNAPTNNGFASVTELKLSEYVAIRGDVFLLTSPNVLGSYVGPEYIFPATKIFKTNANNPVNASNVEFFVNAKFGDLHSQDPNSLDTKTHFSYGFGTGFNIKLSDKTFIRPLDISYLRGTIGNPQVPFHAVLGNHMQLAALLGVRF